MNSELSDSGLLLILVKYMGVQWFFFEISDLMGIN